LCRLKILPIWWRGCGEKQPVAEVGQPPTPERSAPFPFVVTPSPRRLLSSREAAKSRSRAEWVFFARHGKRTVSIFFSSRLRAFARGQETPVPDRRSHQEPNDFIGLALVNASQSFGCQRFSSREAAKARSRAASLLCHAWKVYSVELAEQTSPGWSLESSGRTSRDTRRHVLTNYQHLLLFASSRLRERPRDSGT
jgi:hypothetical protein